MDFEAAPQAVPELRIRVRDQGEGFDPGELADPLAPENLLKASGRGIFLIRNFMDQVEASVHYPCVKRAWVEYLGEHPDPAIDRVE